MRRYIQLASVLLFAIFLFLIFSGGCTNRSAAKTISSKKIAFVSSFHDNHIWTENVRNTMLQTFLENSYRIDLANIYLNAKNIASFDERKQILSAHITPILEKLDAIVVSDLEAAYQILEFAPHIPTHIPIVIASVFDPQIPLTRENIYLLIEEIGIKKSFETARALFPNAQKVYVWSDKTITGAFYLNQARQQLASFEESISIEYGIDADNERSFLEHTSKGMANSFAIFCTWQQGDNGKYYDPLLFYPQIIRNAHIPVFTVINNVMNGGFIGGYVLSPINNGQRVAQKVMEIWSATPEKTLLTKESISPIPVFNKKAMKQWDAPLEGLPSDAIVVYDWKDILVKNKEWIVALSAILGIAACIILLLLFFRKRILRKNTILHTINENYKQLSIRYQNQYNVLEEYREDLDLALEAGEVSVWSYDVKRQVFLSIKGSIFPQGGSTKEETLARCHPEDQPLLIKIFRSILSGEEKGAQISFRFLHADQTYHHYQVKMLPKVMHEEIVSITGTKKDISNEIKLQQSKERTIEKMRSAIKATDFVFIEYDTQTGLFRSFNEPINHYIDTDLISLESYLSYVHPEDRAKIKQFIQQINHADKSPLKPIEIRQQIAREGSWHYCTLSLTPFSYDEFGNVLKCVGFRTDNTTLVNYQKELEEFKLEYQLAVEAGDIQTWIYDIAADRFFSLEADGMIPKEGISMEKARSLIISAEDRAWQQKNFEAILSGEQQKVKGIYRYRINGKKYYYESCVMSRKNEKGEITQLIGTQKDVTEETNNSKQMASLIYKLKFAIQTANMTLWEYNVKNQLFYTYNEPIADFQDNASITEAEYLHYFHPEDQQKPDLINATEAMVSGIDKPFSFDARIQTKYDSEWQYCTVVGLPSRKNEAGAVTRYIGIRLNNTSLVKNQLILEEEKKRALQSDKLKSAFLANMSHEIRTPLNAIVGFSELLQSTDIPEDRAEFIKIINQNNELLLHLIEDILDLSKIESGMIDLKKERLDLAQVADDLYASLKKRKENPRIQFMEVNPFKECIVSLDKNRLIQIWSNFLTNAFKYTPQGKIEMGYTYCKEGIQIYVEDSGIGISPEKQKRVFNRFEKLDDFAQGTGLGLAICKAITDKMEGEIGVDSKRGVGSRFWAWIPCQATLVSEPSQEVDLTEKAPVSEIQEKSTSLLTYTLLVAEDNDSNYLLTKAILKSCNLDRAFNGEEALNLATQNQYDAILMDLKMPKMDGLEATRKIRTFDTHTPIIALTANAFPTDETKALEAGCTAFVAKPIQREALLRTITKAITLP